MLNQMLQKDTLGKLETEQQRIKEFFKTIKRFSLAQVPLDSTCRNKRQDLHWKWKARAVNPMSFHQLDCNMYRSMYER